MKVRARAAVLSDYRQIIEYDEFPGDRRIDLQAGELSVADIEGWQAVGYLRIAPRDFFGWPLVANVCVHEGHRRRGIGRLLMQFAKDDGRYIRLYTSTEDANSPMQALIEGIGGHRIGYVDKLNFSEEREVIYRLK